MAIIVSIWVELASWLARVAGRRGHSFIFSLFIFPAALIVSIPASLIVAYMVRTGLARALRPAP
jgi:hypothetical protein